jgi:hypothetical protein
MPLSTVQCNRTATNFLLTDSTTPATNYQYKFLELASMVSLIAVVISSLMTTTLMTTPLMTTTLILITKKVMTTVLMTTRLMTNDNDDNNTNVNDTDEELPLHSISRLELENNVDDQNSIISDTGTTDS